MVKIKVARAVTWPYCHYKCFGGEVSTNNLSGRCWSYWHAIAPYPTNL